jgi:23S rRNA (uracil1939-C5)-methyltransferase
MNKGDIIEIRVTGLDDTGKGIAIIGGRRATIEGALKGEKIQARILGFREGTPALQLVKVLEPSPDRTEPKCEYFTACGGCSLQHMNYERQLQFKADQLSKILLEFDINIAPQYKAHVL